MPKALLVSIGLVIFILGIGTGFAISPWYQESKSSHSDAFARADLYTDYRYLNAMSTHHLGAILLAQKASANSTRPEIQQLSKMILENEPKSIDTLLTYKKAWYNDRTPATYPLTSPNLGPKDDKFDLRFLNALITHHEEGISMAKAVKNVSTRAEVIDDADSVINFLTKSLQTLKDWRSTWYQQ